MAQAGAGTAEATARAQPAQSGGPFKLQGIDRLFAVTLVLLVVIFHWQLAASGKFGVLEGDLGDTDSYTWMVRAETLHDTGRWFYSKHDRIDPPHGLQQHWTRPLDSLLLGGAYLFAPFMDFEDALFLSGLLVSPILHLLGLAALMWGLGPLLGRGRAPLLGILFLAQLGITGYSTAGRPDHHALLLLLTNLMIMLSARLAVHKPDPRLGLGLGAVMALALWSGVEAIVPIFGCLLGLALIWFLGGTAAGLGRKMVWTSIGAAGFGLTGLLLERGPAALSPAFEIDRYSAFHVYLLSLTLVFWGTVRLAERRGLKLDTMKARALVAAGAVAVAGAGLALLFPEFLAFDLVPMDPFYRQTRFSQIGEYQPILSARGIAHKGFWDAFSQALVYAGIVLPGLAYLIYALLCDTDARRRMLWMVCAATAASMLVIYGYEGGFEFRDTPFLELIALYPYTELCFRVLKWIGGRFTGLTLSAVRPLATVVLLGWFIFPAVAVALIKDEKGPPKSGQTACPVKTAAPALNALDDPARLQTVMAFVDFGPELLYRTPHAVLSIPNHHSGPGYRDSWAAMTAGGPDEMRAILARRGVDFLLICDSAITRSFYAQLGAKDTFREALIGGASVPWLEPVALPGAATGLHLYAVRLDG